MQRETSPTRLPVLRPTPWSGYRSAQRLTVGSSIGIVDQALIAGAFWRGLIGSGS